MIIGSTTNENHYDAYRKSGDKKVQAQAQRITQQAVQVRVGGNLSVLAGGDLALVASQLNGGYKAYLIAGGKVQLLAEQDYYYSFSEKKKKGSILAQYKWPLQPLGLNVVVAGLYPVISMDRHVLLKPL